MLQSRGISDLLAAEKVAQDCIEEARKRKNKRLKEAQNEAKSEIENFKGQRDKLYKSLEDQQLGNRKEMDKEWDKATQVQIVSLKDQYESNKEDLLQRVLTLVCDIKPEPHVNARVE